MSENAIQLGAPLRDRSPEEIRKKLEALELDEATIKSWLKLHKYAVDSHPPLGMTALSQQCRISTSILSPGFGGIYTGDYVAIATRIEQFFWRLDQQRKYGGLREFVATQLSTALLDLFEKTRITRRIQCIQSPEQVGKTRTAIKCRDDNNSGRTIYCSVSGGNKSGFGQFVWDLGEAVEVPYSIKLSEKRIRIKHALRGCDLLILDEMHLVDDWTEQAKRDFWDYLRTDLHSNGARGVVLIYTNNDPIRCLHRLKMNARYNIGQLLGRMRNNVVRIDPAEDITTDDIRALVSRYYKPGADAVKRLHKVCTEPGSGHFGLLDDILNESWSLAQARNKPMNDEIVIETAREILGEQEQHKELFK